MFKRFGQCAWFFERALLIGIVFTVIGKYPLELMLSPSVAAERVLNALSGLVPSVAAVFLLMRRRGYTEDAPEYKNTMIAFGMVFALWLGLTALTDGAVWFSVFNKNLAEAILLGDTQIVPEEKKGAVRLLTCGLTLLADVCLYLPAALSGEYCGVRKRLRDRNELTKPTE